MFILMDIVFIYDLMVNHRATEDQARGMSDENMIYSKIIASVGSRCIFNHSITFNWTSCEFN